MGIMETSILSSNACIHIDMAESCQYQQNLDLSCVSADFYNNFHKSISLTSCNIGLKRNQQIVKRNEVHMAVATIH